MKEAALENRINNIAQRIRSLREIVGYTTAEMAQKTGVPEEEYILCESGGSDLSFAFLYTCAQALNVDVTDLIEGSSPRLAGYALTRKGNGQHIQQAHGMVYYNLAASFKNRIAEPLLVRSSFSLSAQDRPIELTTHDGQECDIVMSGTLKVQIGKHIEILHEGDSVYFDSSTPHGMIAIDNADCLFYAIVLNPAGEMDPIGRTATDRNVITVPIPQKKQPSNVKRIWEDFIIPTEDETGRLKSIAFKNQDRFNFAFDVVDRMGTLHPDKTAIMYVAEDHSDRRITFAEMKRASSQTANYFRSLGIRKGDKVLLILKRHYQFWYSMIALHKLGAVAIPATFQLKEHDITYRLNKAGIKAVVCTSDGDISREIDKAALNAPGLQVKIMVGGARDDWHDFNSEYSLFTGRYDRKDDTPCGDETMLMYFTSGTTGNPKIAKLNYRYPLGHFITARYWQCVDPDGFHLTIADSGWAKCAWGKLYGQWLCEAPLFVYDFRKFDPADILPLFKKYGITTFCAPPTMLRMMIKEDLDKYDLSSVEHMTTAGEALNPEVFRQFEKSTGLKIMEGFGQSETTVALANLMGEETRIGSMGRPVPLYDIKLLDENGFEVPVGEVGEICISIKDGIPCGLFSGYYEDEEKTRECMHDGWYRTGDTAWRDEDGYFWYIGRVDDVIKSSGYRIGPFEIENVIMELPYVLECGVSAAPDEVRGQIVKASIVLVKGKEPTDALKREIQDYVKQHTAPYKYPRMIVFRDSLPKTTSGKIQRNLL